ncbi:MAG: hypothetical protein ACOYOU_08040 [Kiritimatiellia bacterium]
MLPTPQTDPLAADDRHATRLHAHMRIGAWFLCCAAAAALVVFSNGNALVVPAACAVIVFVLLQVRYLEVGIYLLLAAVMVLDQFIVWGIKPPYLAAQGMKFFLNLNTTTGIAGLTINPVEILLAMLLGAWFLRAASTREWHFYRVPNMGVAALFFVMLSFYTGYGIMSSGGNWKAALWEVRSLFYLGSMYFLVTQFIRTPQQVRVCLWIIMAGLAIRGLEGCWRYFVTLERDISHVRAILGHEDSTFFVTGFVLLAAMTFLGYRGREWKFLVWTAAPNLLTFVLNQRRITFGVLGLCLGLAVILQPRERFRASLRFVLPALVLLAVYTTAFWNRTGVMALPAQKIKSIFVTQEGTADEQSKGWRQLELINLRATVKAYPEGLGFGQKYLILVPYADILDYFPLWNYIPHCAIYWMWVKTGFVGFVIFWLFFGVAIAQATMDYRAIRDPYYKAVALMAMLFIVGQIIVSFYDLQLTYYRNMIYLGLAMALGTVVRRLDAQTSAGAAGGAGGR